MMSPVAVCCLLAGLVVGNSWGSPGPLQQDGRPLALVSELSSRLGAHPSRLQDARLPLPTAQDLDAIKKVAQILVMLGQQVIPAIIGEPVSPGACEPAPAAEVSNDPVNINDRQT